MDFQLRQYCYSQDVLATWDKFPRWLNKDYVNKLNNIDNQTNILINARIQITQGIVGVLSRGEGVKQYMYNVPKKGMVIKSILTLAMELKERFHDVDFLIPKQQGNMYISEYKSIDKYDCLEDERPIGIRITFIKS